MVLKRFLDNLFQIYKGTTKNLHKIYEEINQIHSSLPFTMEYTTPENELEEDKCDCPIRRSITYFDTLVGIEIGKNILTKTSISYN